MLMCKERRKKIYCKFCDYETYIGATSWLCRKWEKSVRCKMCGKTGTMVEIFTTNKGYALINAYWYGK